MIKNGGALENEVKRASKMRGLIRAGQGRNKVIKRPGQPKKSDVTEGARGVGMGFRTI